MDFLFYAIIVLFIILTIIKWKSAKGIRQISTVELKEELKQRNKQFIDVRSSAEFQKNHIKGFKNIPFQQFMETADKLPKEKELILICHSGARSQKAAEHCKKLGFKKVSNVRGGIKNWKA